MGAIAKVDIFTPETFKEAFDLALTVEEELLNLDTLLESYEKIAPEDTPPWVYVLRRHYRPLAERLQTLQIFLASRLHLAP